MVTHGAEARQVLNIGLTRFEAIPKDNAVQLEWDTETELGTAGYRLKRGQGGTFDYLMEAGGNGSLFILSEGGPSLGASYSVVDDTASNSEIYTYQLIEVTTDGGETVQADVTVTVGLVPTETPIVLGGSDGGGGGNNGKDTPTPEPTATATTTQAVDNTPVPQATSIPTVADTATPQVAATRTPDTRQSNTTDLSNVAETSVTKDVQGNDSNSEIELEQSDNSAVSVAQTLDEPLAVGLAGDPEASSVPTIQDLPSLELNVDYDPVGTSNGISNSQPIVIGNNQYNDDTQVTPPNTKGSQQSQSSGNAFAGRIYLWIAFIAAVVIFVAAVLGAILLYTRRQNKD